MYEDGLIRYLFKYLSLSFLLTSSYIAGYSTGMFWRICKVFYSAINTDFLQFVLISFPYGCEH